MTKWWAKQSTEDRKRHTEPAHQAYKEMWKALPTEEKDALIQRRCCDVVVRWQSKLEDRVADSLTALGVTHQRQHWVAAKSFDFKIGGTRCLLEVQGDFWHANPKQYTGEDVLHHPSGLVKASDLWSRDDCKRAIAERYGYRVLYVWEGDVDHLDEEGLRGHLRGIIGNCCT